VDLLAPVVKLSGTDLATDWVNALVDMRIELGFRVAGRCTLRFADHDYEFAESGTVALGSKVQVFARADRTLFDGDITGVTIEHRERQPPELVVVAHDRAYRLGRSTTVETYTKRKYSDIVSTLAEKHGLTASVDQTTAVVEYLMQVDSDLALLDALADRTGFDWWVDADTLHFKKPEAGNTVELAIDKSLLSFSVRASGLHADSVRIDGWDRHKQQVVSGHAAATEARLTPDAELLTPYLSPGGKLHGSAELFSAGMAAASPDEATELSEVLRDRTVAAAITARGVVEGAPALKPGVSVRVSGVGPLAGTYHVTEVEHHFRRTGVQTRFVAGDRRPRSLVDTLAGGTNGTPTERVNTTFHHTGLVVGDVTNIKDPEQMGRVKVRYPGLSSEQESGWARVLTMGGGKERGMVFLPEVGDEVLVGFEGGDLRQPVVLGGLYGAKSTIPLWDVDQGKVDGRRITSRLGHYVELGDGSSADKQHVMLMLAGQKSKLRLGKDRVDLEVPAGVPVALKSGNASITLGDDGSITLKGAKIVIEGDQSVAISAKGNVKLVGDQSATVESKLQAAVKGAQTDLEGSGIMQIKGGLVKIN
jgi:uncharacterized protein involved in type VI secretion and phage assembly